MTQTFNFQELADNVQYLPLGMILESNHQRKYEVDYLRDTWHSEIKTIYDVLTGLPARIDSDMAAATFKVVEEPDKYTRIAAPEAIARLYKAFLDGEDALPANVFWYDGNKYIEVELFEELRDHFISDFDDLFRKDYFEK